MSQENDLKKLIRETDQFLKSQGVTQASRYEEDDDPLTHENYEEKDDPSPIFDEDDDTKFTPEQNAILDAWEAREGNRRHVTFIKEMVAHGDRRQAYQRAYPGVSNKSACVNACRLLAKPEIAQPIREALLAMKMSVTDLLKQQFSDSIADMAEKRKVLAQMLRGELVMEKEVATKTGIPATIKLKPDMKDRLRAIIIDNKMEEELYKAVALPDKGVHFS